MKRYKLPDHNHDQWASFLANQWHLHSNHLASTTARSSQKVRQLCTATSHLVRLPADHHPHRVYLACPLHFFTLLNRTFANGTVFSVCHPQPLDEILSELKRAVPTTLRKTYAWGFNWKRTIPYAYFLPKESKLWQAARLIVSYSDTWCTPLTSALALAIFEIMRHTLPAHLVTTDTKLILKTLHSNLTKLPHVWGLQFRQQHISGCFNSVGHDRIIFCVERLLQRFTQQQDYHFSVQVQRKH